MSAASYDAVLVGSGINSLVCAALLARKGRKVLVLERNDLLGGCIRTEELTLPGFLHDTLSTAHPLFMVGPAFAALGKDLQERGLEYCNTSLPTAAVCSNGQHLALSTSRADNMRRMDAFVPGAGAAYAAAIAEVEANAELIFTLLGNELWRWTSAKTLLGTAWKQGSLPFTGFFGAALEPASAWLPRAFGSANNPVSALLAPWVLHTGLGPNAPLSALMDKVVAFTLEAVGMPMVKGGNARTVEAFKRLIEQHGGAFRTKADVVQVLVEGDRAAGVQLADGSQIRAREVIANVTPTQLYQRLLAPALVPPEVMAQSRAYRYGKGNMQIHLALKDAPRWNAAELASVGYVHLTDGADAVSRAVSEAERGLLPAEPTICVAQPTALDPSRAPAGQHILWIQLPECPRELRADALDQIDCRNGWSASVREQYADRVLATVGRHIPNLAEITIGRKVLSPPDLEALNMNLVGGDPYGGDCSLDQSFLWRPLRATRNHETPLKGLWHIGASTHPGPGLGGTSGFHVAQALTGA